MSPLRMRGYERREALYRLLLLTLPRAFRHEFAEEILDAFRDGYREHHTRFGYAAARRFARRSALHVFGCAVRLRMPRRPVAFASSPRSSQWLINVWRDGLIGLRAFAQKPGFFVMAAGTIGLGIGAVTTVFSVVDKVLLRPLPYPEPERIVYFENSSHSLPEFHDWRDRTDSFESLVAVRVVDYDWRAVDEPRRLRTALVTSGFFTLFGAGTVLGQPLVGPAVPGAVPVVLSHAMWQLHWGASPDVIGAQMTINGTPTTVTGVMDPRFQVPEIMVGKSIDVWMPLDESDVLYQDRGTHLLEVAGRLEPSVTLEAAPRHKNQSVSNRASHEEGCTCLTSSRKNPTIRWQRFADCRSIFKAGG